MQKSPYLDQFLVDFHDLSFHLVDFYHGNLISEVSKVIRILQDVVTSLRRVPELLAYSRVTIFLNSELSYSYKTKNPVIYPPVTLLGVPTELPHSWNKDRNSSLLEVNACFNRLQDIGAGF